MSEPILNLENYAVSFYTPKGEVQAVRGIDFSVKEGEILCIVGDSGCGKTVMCESVMKLLPPEARIKSGRDTLCGTDITDYREKHMREIRGNLVSMVFQDRMMT
ncbi:MAG: ATP-binding cassette domain-containing protein, partial [Lachnospiraceae bacterium]|nr:ATP-binding cassette domain-containing protein [Lachnospiraceae bacterium]